MFSHVFVQKMCRLTNLFSGCPRYCSSAHAFCTSRYARTTSRVQTPRFPTWCTIRWPTSCWICRTTSGVSNVDLNFYGAVLKLWGQFPTTSIDILLDESHVFDGPWTNFSYRTRASSLYVPCMHASNSRTVNPPLITVKGKARDQNVDEMRTLWTCYLE